MQIFDPLLPLANVRLAVLYSALLIRARPTMPSGQLIVGNSFLKSFCMIQ